MSQPAFTRAIVIVLDGAGIGALPDAALYGDEGTHTLGHVIETCRPAIPTLRSLGLARLVGAHDSGDPGVAGAFGRMAEASAGKDSVTGHWELMGVVLDRPFPVFPQGFPAELIAGLEARIGRRTLGNVVASGTAIIESLGDEHVRTGRPIVYTSADSVLQIAAHENVIAVSELYRICEVAFDLACRGLGVGRVIARPFTGEPGAFTRTARRHDFAVEPAGDTLLDLVAAAGRPVVGIGKVRDLFAGRGITRSLPSASDAEGMAHVKAAMEDTPAGLVLANLVDFDTLYGHRNDAAGYAANLERFDRELPGVLDRLVPGDLLVVTADHGNDPTTPGTDHTREYVPVLVTGDGVGRGIDLGTRATFADLGQTLAEALHVGPMRHGVSFLEQLGAEHS
ncbi:MAG: phosphopentomutase [Acidimicrobiia bacterium]|nr:phosphopentomutase [Acidimicrobiia bacterium]